MADERMPGIEDKSSRKLTAVEKELIRNIEKLNIERVAKLNKVRRNNKITGLILGAGVLGIYGYTMHAIRQETFLDDFDEPQKTTQ
ncbi:cytochrome c oxidase assembly factor 3, mitochondrial [Athalia rosae]|uniref:cytochrome c oxidase assembly factor 3, mitochondrial n=1 Tax=Athalia rosae TaxID=37344 RepID=UPI0020341E56|nr:cytochrome c oxidase assembly factor 3, mitochondrial [Athalia rosae]XP_048515148.1 cytochrome c oxidase assembly factor 3, mitochondrial [Athalia rosae]